MIVHHPRVEELPGDFVRLYFNGGSDQGFRRAYSGGGCSKRDQCGSFTDRFLVPCCAARRYRFFSWKMGKLRQAESRHRRTDDTWKAQLATELEVTTDSQDESHRIALEAKSTAKKEL